MQGQGPPPHMQGQQMPPPGMSPQGKCYTSLANVVINTF
jgi:hypothetical protein